MLQAVALGDRDRQLLFAEDTVFEQEAANGFSGGRGCRNRIFDDLAVGKAELDDDVREEGALATLASTAA